MALPAVSVVVASQGRPAWLARCLTALAQLDYPAFEIVVAADAAGLAAVAAQPSAASVKTVRADAPNISATRNAGIALAAGEILAFIDDDAVPEPLWLRHHADALAATGAAASLGCVRGRNGISFQSRVVAIDAEAESHDLPFPGEAPGIPDLAPGQALKLIGTNFAIRRDVLLALGGFDPAYRFYLDDSDLSLRLARAGFRAAVAPLAEVHHGVAPSARRTARRFPKGLRDIGRSTAIFLARHGGKDVETVHGRMVARERRRLIAHMVHGTCEPRDVTRALSDLAAGWAEGLAHEAPPPAPLVCQPPEFKVFPAGPSGHAVMFAGLLARASARRDAAAIAAAGRRVTLISLSRTPVRHRVVFDPSGVWTQTGGQFGRSVRSEPLWRWCSFARRVKEEVARVEKLRGINEDGTRVGYGELRRVNAALQHRSRACTSQL